MKSLRGHRGRAVLTIAAESSAVFPNQKPNLATARGLAIPQREFTKEISGSLCLWGWGRVKTFIFKILCFLLNLPWFISLRNLLLSSFAYKMQMHCFPSEHFEINTTKLPEGFIPQGTPCMQNLAVSQLYSLRSPSAVSLFCLTYNLPSPEAGAWRVWWVQQLK